MGDLIQLDDWRADRSRPEADAVPAFFFSLSCPLSYLTAEHVERTLGEAVWIPVATESLHSRRSESELTDLRRRAEARARALRLPLVWPDRFPADVPCALRAADYAGEIGAGPRFALAASRLAFCGGFDLEDPETLAEAGAAAGVALDACLAAAGEDGRDEALHGTAMGLRTRGVNELPAIRVGRRWFAGETGLLAACAMLRRPAGYGRPLAPVG